MINQLFDTTAIRQNIEEVNQEVEKIKQNLSTLTAKIKIEVPGDIQTQINALNTTYNSINHSLGEITTGQLRYAKALTESAKQSTEAAKQAKLYAQAKRQIAVSAQQLADVLGKEAKSMAEAAEQNRILRAAAKQLDLTKNENIDTLKQYNKQIEANTEFIRKNSDAHVQQKMNIGNYNSVWKGLNTSVQQLVRELPSAKYGLDIFFLAISNNIPILMDSIKQMQEFNKEMVRTGQLDKKVSVGKEVLKSLISWQTAIMVGITLLVQYGDEIINWVGNLIKGNNALSSAKITQDALNEAWKDGATNAQKELTQLRLLTKSVSDNALSMNDRKKALTELKKQYPEYLSNLTDEEILAGKVGDAYTKIATSIMQTAIAQAQFNQATKMAEEIVKMQSENASLKGLNSIEDIDAELDRINKRQNELYKGGYTRVLGLDFLSDDAGRELNKLDKTKKEIEEYRKAYVAMIEFIDSKSFVKTLKGERKGERKGKTYAEILAEIISEHGAEVIIEERDRALQEIDNWFNEETKAIKNKGGSYAEAEAQALAALQSARLNKIKEVNSKFDAKISREANKIARGILGGLTASLKGMDNTYAADQDITTVQLLNEQTLLNNKYNQGLINEREYNEQLNAIKKRYAEEALNTQIKYAEFELDTIVGKREELINRLRSVQNELKTTQTDSLKAEEAGLIQALLGEDLSEENISRITSLISKLRAELEYLRSEGVDTPYDWNKYWDENLTSILNTTEDIFGEISNLVSAVHDARLQQIEEETKAVEKSHELQLDSLERLYQQGAISQEEYEARKRLQEEMTLKRQEELEKKRAELLTKQAKYEKASAIASALINVALGITSAMTLPPPANVIAASITSAMGALQVATIMATPLPKYAKGTSYHKGGLAVVGDGGKNEVVLTENGAYITPDTPTVMNLPRGAKVLSDVSLLDAENVKLHQPLLGGISYDDKGMPIIINDYSALEREQRLTRREIEKQRKEMRKIEKRRQLNEYKRRLS